MRKSSKLTQFTHSISDPGITRRPLYVDDMGLAFAIQDGLPTRSNVFAPMLETFYHHLPATYQLYSYQSMAPAWICYAVG